MVVPAGYFLLLQVHPVGWAHVQTRSRHTHESSHPTGLAVHGVIGAFISAVSMAVVGLLSGVVSGLTGFGVDGVSVDSRGCIAMAGCCTSACAGASVCPSLFRLHDDGTIRSAANSNRQIGLECIFNISKIRMRNRYLMVMQAVARFDFTQ